MRVPPGSQLVFDQIVSATSGDGPTVTSDPRFNDWLGQANDQRFWITVDRATALGVVTVQVETTADEERAWTLRGTVVDHQTFPDTGAVFQGADTIAIAGFGSLGYRRMSVFLTAEIPVSARVRIWAAGRNGYRQFNRLLFCERLTGTELVVVPFAACDWLASVDTMAFGVQTDEVTGAAPNLAVYIDESSNAMLWNPYFSVNWGPVSGALITEFAGGDPNPWSGFIRFSLQFLSSGNAASVRLWVTGRDVRSS